MLSKNYELHSMHMKRQKPNNVYSKHPLSLSKGNMKSLLLGGNSGVDSSLPLMGLGVGALPSITLALAFLIEENEYLFEIS
ncbi:MAG: hypothetical protein CV087_03870 [Candidatus Brocadia sp. WS118]|nr:MAG: hypothetical protein CV087_03870 [Candidatus Brocadia sp. WS118]